MSKSILQERSTLRQIDDVAYGVGSAWSSTEDEREADPFFGITEEAQYKSLQRTFSDEFRSAFIDVMSEKEKDGADVDAFGFDLERHSFDVERFLVA